MNISELAREARLAEPSHPFNPWGASNEALERFAALVRTAALEEAAGVCDREARHAYRNDGFDNSYETGKSVAAKNCAAAIRQLKETK